MSQSKKSNDERAARRAQCRAVLAEHINQKLHLSISPEDVRLITTPEDPYRWAPLPSAKHLFTKQLSKHCLGAYQEIFDQVGKTFEAVLNDLESDHDSSFIRKASKRSSADAELCTYWIASKRPRLPSPEETFTGRIAALEEENSKLKAQVEHGRLSLEKAKGCQKALEDSLCTAQTRVESSKQDISQLQSLHRRSAMAVERYRLRAKWLDTSLGEVISAVKRIEKQQSEKLLAPPRIV